MNIKEEQYNCNDCKYLKRSVVKRQQHVDFHYNMQKEYFNNIRIKLIQKGEFHQEKAIQNPEKADYYNEKAKKNFREARNMKFVFDEGSCSLFYGRCKALNKEVSFIPNIIMLENFNCHTKR